MPESKPISVRIPQDLLEQLDTMAYRYYPPRKRGAAPNRSQMILDFITQGIEHGSRQTAYDKSEKSKGRDISYDNFDSEQTAYDSTDNRQLISVYDRVIIEEVVRQQLSQLGIANEIALLHQEITELKNLVADRPSQSQPPEPASEQQADHIPPEQLDLASAETHAQQEFQPQSVAPQRSDRDRSVSRLDSDEKGAHTVSTPIDESDRIPPEQLDSATAETQAQSTLQPESAAPEQSHCDRANTVLQPVYDPYAYTPPERDHVLPGQPPQKPGNRIVKIDTAEDLFHEILWCLSDGGHFILFRSFVPPQKIGYFLEHRAYSDGERQVKTALAKDLIKRGAIRSDDPTKGPGSGHREFYIWNDRDFAPRNSDRTPPEQLDSATAETHAQQEFQPQQSDSPSNDRHLIATESDKPTPKFPEWMTARQAFESLGGDPGDRDSSVASIDGLKQIKFSTFKKKTSSELKPFRLELSQDRKRRRLPCYRLLKPSDEDILRLIGDLDQRLRTDNYLPIFHLREKLQPLLSREELDQALYRLSKNDRIELSALQEVTAYTPEQIDAGIPQNVGGRLFFILRVECQQS